MPTWTTPVNQVSNLHPGLRKNLHSPSRDGITHAHENHYLTFLWPNTCGSTWNLYHFSFSTWFLRSLGKIKQSYLSWRKLLLRRCKEKNSKIKIVAQSLSNHNSMVGGMVQNSQSLNLFTFNALIIIHEYIYSYSATTFIFSKYINSHLTAYFLFTNILLNLVPREKTLGARLYIYSLLRDVFIYIQRFIFFHIHDRNIGSTRCNIHSSFSAHRLRASFGPSSRSIISERNMADEGRTFIWRGRKKTTTRQSAQSLKFILCPALKSSELDKYSISEVVLGKQRWRSGESPRQCGPGSLPDRRWVEFVVGSHLAPWVSLWGLRFSLIHKKNPASPNSNSTRIEGLHEEQLMWLPF